MSVLVGDRRKKPQLKAIGKEDQDRTDAKGQPKRPGKERDLDIVDHEHRGKGSGLELADRVDSRGSKAVFKGDHRVPSQKDQGAGIEKVRQGRKSG